ncbi:response regulator transcription factor [Paraburkholderia antibiotica]|uniref:Response regulator transcription factor n=1 Tax=Paraburkholderia antibiotica TaxID=2728839 RepID=A0A7X9ZYA9_9BURK|nr:response regulator transcription factor [Paraburkholderia antibiotica]NML32721.1 response regulator transcription factor [Paraburkholderia antibiotica]
MKIDVVLADDHPALIAGMKFIIGSSSVLNISGVAQNPDELVQLLEKVHCDVLVTDYSMPDCTREDGMAMLSNLRRRYPDLRIIVFSVIENPAIAREIARIGIQSIISKKDRLDRLVSAIHAVYAGAVYFPDPEGKQDATLMRISLEKSDKEVLSPREKEVVRLYVAGLPGKEIGRRLKITKQTVSSQKASAMRKLGITRDADLFQFSFEVGLNAPESSTPPVTDQGESDISDE